MRASVQSLVALVILCNVISAIPPAMGQDVQQSFEFMAVEADRDKRALDLGFLVRNLLMKSAYASNTKAAIAGNVINAKITKTTRRPTTTTRRPTTTTLAPIFNKKSFWFPFTLSSAGFPPPVNKVNAAPPLPARPGPGPGPGGARGGGGGGLFLDYDYIDQLRPVQQPTRRRRPTTTTAAPITTTTRTTTAAPPPPRRPQAGRRPLPKRPSFPNYDYYDDDYDYGQVGQKAATTTRPPPPPPPAPTARGRARKPQAQNSLSVQLGVGVTPNRPARLRNRPLYQYAQNTDFSINNGGLDDATPEDNNNNANPNNNDPSNTANDDEDSNPPQDNPQADDNGDYVDNAMANVSVDNDDVSALDPNNNSEDDYNDSSDISNPNANGNGSNGNDNNKANDADSGNSETSDDQAPPPSLDYDSDNATPPFNNAAIGAPTPSSQGGFNSPFFDLRSFNGPRFGNGRGPALDPSTPQLGQSFGLPANYQNFPYSGFNDYGSPYQQPSSPVGYSVRYY
uniref:Uncharacterized protein n=1 Tax=Stomoxys calcitrans TaxID=35570 RepID=A0A1I8QFE0_STOCA